MTDNPWGLNERECLTMCAVIEHGSAKAAARVLHRTEKAIEYRVGCAKRKMNAAGAGEPWSHIHNYILWDRWVREKAEQEPMNGRRGVAHVTLQM